ncbi:MAG: phosphonate ABC transporter ATP-binding protein [Thermodesulfobacteriota bacterium]|nr:phosphonate ABC transporter ATP-binding protein [Thermodesulfobacteriota bacterium]
MLELHRVSRIYKDGTRAIDNVSLKIAKGEFCVLLGPSGAGKSTLMGMINGLVLPTDGSVVLWGEELNKTNIKKFQRRVSMIHQQLHLVPRLSVLHNVLTGILPETPLWRTLFNIFPETNQRRACRLLEDVELEEKHIHRRAMALSGGQQQRVAIARAFMSHPSIVLADEPVASLDPNISRNVLSLLKRTATQREATVLCSLHQIEFALEFADRIIGLRQGQLVFDGPPKALNEKALKELYGSEKIPKIQEEKTIIADADFVPALQAA